MNVIMLVGTDSMSFNKKYAKQLMQVASSIVLVNWGVIQNSKKYR